MSSFLSPYIESNEVDITPGSSSLPSPHGLKFSLLDDDDSIIGKEGSLSTFQEGANDENNSSRANEETDEEKVRRLAQEEHDTAQLIWEMMRQEAQSAYDLQMAYMRDNSDGMSEEDMACLQMAMNEGGGDPSLLIAEGGGRRQRSVAAAGGGYRVQ